MMNNRNKNEHDCKKDILKSFNWSKERGLVRYTTQDGVVFDYWKKK